MLGRRVPWMFVAAMLALPAPSGVTHTGDTGTQRSTITVRVFKAGLFSAFAHNHIIVAPIDHGMVDTANLRAEILVRSSELKVTDPGINEKERSDIQGNMLGPKVLNSERFPEITFHSSHIEPLGKDRYRVDGTLTLHGRSNQLSFEVEGTFDHYHGLTRLKQTDFGIIPISMGGGSIKVKDQLEIEFDIYPGDLTPIHSSH